MGEKKTNIPCRKIPKNLCRQSPFKGKEYLPLLKWAVHCDVLPKSKAQKMEKEKDNFTSEKPDNHSLSQVIKVNTNSDESC